jgi:hypothetical protein
MPSQLHVDNNDVQYGDPNRSSGAGFGTDGYKQTGAPDSVSYSGTQGTPADAHGLSLTHQLGGGNSLQAGFSGGASSSLTLGGSSTQGLGGGRSLSERLSANLGASGASWDGSLKYAGPSSSASLGVKGSNDAASFSLGGSTKMSGLSLNGSLDASQGAKGSTYGGKLSEQWGSGGFAEGMSIGASSGPKGDLFNFDGFILSQFLPGLFGGGFGSFSSQLGKDQSYFGGGSLTYLPHPSFGITAAAGGGSGGYEGRLQADYFGAKGVHGANELAARRANPSASGYIDVSSGKPGALDHTFGGADASAQLGNGHPTVSVGVGFGI